MSRRTVDWTEPELVILRREYPGEPGGTRAVRRALIAAGYGPRSDRSIYKAASNEGIKAGRSKYHKGQPGAAAGEIMSGQDSLGLLADLHGLEVVIGMRIAELREYLVRLQQLSQVARDRAATSYGTGVQRRRRVEVDPEENDPAARRLIEGMRGRSVYEEG